MNTVPEDVTETTLNRGDENNQILISMTFLKGRNNKDKKKTW